MFNFSCSLICSFNILVIIVSSDHWKLTNYSHQLVIIIIIIIILVVCFQHFVLFWNLT